MYMQGVSEELHVLRRFCLEMFRVLQMKPRSCAASRVILLYRTFLTAALFCFVSSSFVGCFTLPDTFISYTGLSFKGGVLWGNMWTQEQATAVSHVIKKQLNANNHL